MTAAAPASTSNQVDVILIAPNVSEQMGGEAIKALQIYLELKRQGVRVHQITHVRVRKELEKSFPDMQVTYTPDTKLQEMLHRGKLFEQLLNLDFLLSATKAAEQLLRQNPDALVHFTSPVSPVLPYPSLHNAKVVIGPVNGNIHYPVGFRERERAAYKIRRWLHPAMQFLHRMTFRGKQNADAVLVSGGERSFASLRMAGCRDERLLPSIDSGVLDRLYDQPRIEHHGENLRFFHNGRLVEHKGTDLIVRSLLKTKRRIVLDIIGRGPELGNLRALVDELKLKDRVNFIEWVPDHSKLSEMLRQYRAFVFPSLAEANGIVVQEAMVQGLPVIACDWGGPSLLVTPETGILIDPKGEQYVIDHLAASMDQLAGDPELAESMSVHARERALRDGYLWSGVIKNWRKVYSKVTLRSI
ncbi:MAG: glycosyltransferase family 4 protein [Edaphobacter sp.]|uniref:glycosyltransferase family 4 protein n=1 Tax=Edaphobacter sp. TaxID=1934404 RepID=UPI00238FBC82|nr:glycosyltransferase family 4 protein [Edaphobacter sp.]MDE1175199.1 glycosyltransferase family 4 protein [Edaphobacter sp.]